MRSMSIVASLLGLSIGASAANAAAASQQPVAKVDVKKVQRFCDVGFRLTANGIQFDIEKLLQLAIKVERKALLALDSQAAIHITALTYYCRLVAANMISPERFVEAVTGVLQYAVDLQALRQRAEKEAGGPVSSKPDPRFDAKVTAAEDLDLRVETSIQVGEGELKVVLRRVAQRYFCQCTPGR